ncbi:ABC transporter permease [Defluviimonas salinarum]|uniref:ABC transporter permease subunit n=1 Tax=Defluviimonas salinarum TaxID=2992147 RepID=A0ABT3J7F6_9RHOB|nr:ABC transporter permease subunit [Defluviimonas salinarum]MCW3783622.1 ABC transporter permease subunit [Defluviimonas salinarum]
MSHQGSSKASAAIRVTAILAAIAVAAAFCYLLPRSNGLVVFPADWTVDWATPLTDWMKYLSRDFDVFGLQFAKITRFLGWLVSQPFEILGGVMGTGFTFYRVDAEPFVIPPLPWTGITICIVLVAHHVGTSRLALWSAATFLFFAVFGLWESAMLTLSSVTIAVIIGGFIGVLLGVLGYRKPWVDALLQPIYDIMQTLPLFSYLVPMILFFGFGPIAALMATVIFALPPMARVTTQALNAVPNSVKEFGRIAGATRFQRTWWVLVPAARKQLLLGLNQLIMLSLAVVIVASLIGAGGLGGDVLKALRSVRMGDALASGFAITFMAITLDRLSYAVAMRRHVHETVTRGWLQRNKLLVSCLAAMAATIALSTVLPALHTYPDAWTVELGRFGNGVVSWISSTFDAQITGLRDGTIVWFLKPTKIFFLSVPWAGFVLVVGVVGWALGGWRLALLGVAIFTAIALLGYWKKAMISLYIVVLSVFASMIIGFALGLWGGLSDRANRALTALVDILQTLPTFVYLIPVVMLFSIGDFPAFVAIVLYAIAPGIRYTAAGIRGVRENLIEGAMMSGCNRRQMIWQVKVPLALPTILLGLNQVVMMAFGMLVITALVGTRGLEEVTLVAISRVNPGDGLMAGLGIAGMAIVFDRYIKALNRKLAHQLGLPVPK